MSYEQHEWTTGETITAAKMNNIEDGIAEAAQSGGGGNPIMHFIAHSGVSSASWLGSWRLAQKNGTKYEVVYDWQSPLYVIAGAFGGEYYGVSPYPVPQIDGLYLVLVLDTSYVWIDISTDGNISESVVVTVSGYDYDGYVITGDFELEATVDAD